MPAGQEFVGWYLGSMNNGDRLAAETLQYITEEADAADTETDHVIKYYGETQTTTGTLTVTKTVSGWKALIRCLTALQLRSQVRMVTAIA